MTLRPNRFSWPVLALSVLGLPGSPSTTELERPIPVARPVGRIAKAGWVDPRRAHPPLTKYRVFWSPTIGREVSYLVYLPPDYKKAPRRRYPVIYWLHGHGCGPAAGAVFVWRLDSAIRSGAVPPTIAILPNGRPSSMYCDAWDGHAPVESVFIHDLVPHVDATYRTIPRREGRALAGHSMGGFGALRLAFKYPEQFGAVSCLAAALYDPIGLAQRRPKVFREVYLGRCDLFRAESPWALLERNADAIRGRTHIRLMVGGSDWFYEPNHRFHDWLVKFDVPHEFTVVPSFKHDYAPFLTRPGGYAFTFYAQSFARAGNGLPSLSEELPSVASDQRPAPGETRPDSQWFPG